MMMQRRNDEDSTFRQLQNICRSLKDQIKSKTQYYRGSVLSKLGQEEMKNNVSLAAKQKAAQQRNYSIRSTVQSIDCGGVSCKKGKSGGGGGGGFGGGGGGGGSSVGGVDETWGKTQLKVPSTISSLSWAKDSNHMVMIRTDHHRSYQYDKVDKTSHILISRAVSSGKIIKTIDLEFVKDEERRQNSNLVSDCSYSPDVENICVSKYDGKIEIYSTMDNGDEEKGNEEMPILTLQDSDWCNCVTYIDKNKILSGDTQIITWDLLKQCALQKFTPSRIASITDIDVNMQNESVCVSSDEYGSCKIWDIRMDANNNNWTHVFQNDNNDEINCVKFFPDGYSFICGSRDGKIRLYDLKSMQCLNVYDTYFDKEKNTEMIIKGGITDCCFSKSGYFLFATYDLYLPCFIAFNTITGKQIYSHSRIDKTLHLNCVDVSPDGYHIATAGSTNQLHILG